MLVSMFEIKAHKVCNSTPSWQPDCPEHVQGKLAATVMHLDRHHNQPKIHKPHRTCSIAKQDIVIGQTNAA